jgi:hypothetical protein
VVLHWTASHGAAAHRVRKPGGAAVRMGKDKVTTAANGMCSRWEAMSDGWAPLGRFSKLKYLQDQFAAREKDRNGIKIV